MGGEAAEAQILAVTDVMDLADGRVGAIIVSREEGQLDSVYVAFERQGDRVLVDELVDFAPIGGDEEGEGE